MRNPLKAGPSATLPATTCPIHDEGGTLSKNPLHVFTPGRRLNRIQSQELDAKMSNNPRVGQRVQVKDRSGEFLVLHIDAEQQTANLLQLYPIERIVESAPLLSLHPTSDKSVNIL